MGMALLKYVRDYGVLLAEERVWGPISEELSGSMGKAQLCGHGELIGGRVILSVDTESLLELE